MDKFNIGKQAIEWVATGCDWKNEANPDLVTAQARMLLNGNNNHTVEKIGEAIEKFELSDQYQITSLVTAAAGDMTVLDSIERNIEYYETVLNEGGPNEYVFNEMVNVLKLATAIAHVAS